MRGGVKSQDITWRSLDEICDIASTTSEELDEYNEDEDLFGGGDDEEDDSQKLPPISKARESLSRISSKNVPPDLLALEREVLGNISYLVDLK